MTQFVPVAIVAVLICGNVFAGQAERNEKEVLIELGGLRQVKATLSTLLGEYRVEVRMLPVKSFDPSTNGQLNRDKARVFALQALAKHLSDGPKVGLVVRGAEVIDTGRDGKFYTLTLRVPKKGVLQEPKESQPPVKPSKVEKTGVERIVSASALLTREQDHLDTLQRLVDTTTTTLETICKKAPIAGDKDRPFFVAIAEVEERSEANLKNLAKEVEGDDLLLSVEKAELLQVIEERRVGVLQALKEAVGNRELKTGKEKSP
jgi:hypothetical protein